MTGQATNDSKKVREALEPHGYTETDFSMPEYPDRFSEFTRPGAGEIGTFYGTERPLGWQRCLVHFLDDRAQTGARVKDLCSHTEGTTKFSHYVDEGKFSDPDRTIAEAWCRRFGLAPPDGWKVFEYVEEEE